MGEKLILSFLAIFAVHLTICSQDIYLLRYKSPDKGDSRTYDAFFSLSGNGTGTVRVKPGDNAGLTVEMDIEENYARDKENMPDMKYLVYEGKNPRVVQGDRTKNVPPVTFWFKQNEGNFYDPWAVSSASGISAPADNNFLSVEWITSSDLPKKKDLVSLFYSDTSAYYQNLYGSRSKGGFLTPDERRNTRLYLVVVASTNDPTLKTNCLIDARKIIGTFSDIANNVLGLLPRNIYIDTIFGDNYSRASVEKSIQKVQPSKNDLVIFYYSGHGFHNNKYPKKEYPFFDLRDPTKHLYYKDLETETLNVEDIFNTIKSKGARFNLVLSDCCNDTVAAPKKTGLQPPGRKGLTRANFNNARALFMGSQPVNLLMTAATKGEEAVVTTSFNSYFTYFFIQSLTTYLSPEKSSPSWAQIMSATTSQTIRQVNGLPCKANINCPKQTPKALVPGLRF